jgi:hypothetical protein
MNNQSGFSDNERRNIRVGPEKSDTGFGIATAPGQRYNVGTHHRGDDGATCRRQKSSPP